MGKPIIGLFLLILLTTTYAELAYAIDTDGDTVDDIIDNCVEVPNIDQRDNDSDGYGNVCDMDFNNDCFVNAVDLATLRAYYFTPDNRYDINSDGIVDTIDYLLLMKYYFGVPGPGQGSCAP